MRLLAVNLLHVASIQEVLCSMVTTSGMCTKNRTGIKQIVEWLGKERNNMPQASAGDAGAIGYPAANSGVPTGPLQAHAGPSVCR